jgi:hypothetical protein
MAAKYWPPPKQLADKRFKIYGLPKVWNDYNTNERVASHYSSAASQNKLIRRQWDEQELEAQEVGFANAEYAKEVAADGRLPQTQEHLAKLPVAIFNANPKTLDEWMANKAPGDKFKIAAKVPSDVQRLAPEIKKREDFVRALEQHGIETTTIGKQMYGERRSQG